MSSLNVEAFLDSYDADQESRNRSEREKNSQRGVRVKSEPHDDDNERAAWPKAQRYPDRAIKSEQSPPSQRYSSRDRDRHDDRRSRDVFPDSRRSNEGRLRDTSRERDNAHGGSRGHRTRSPEEEIDILGVPPKKRKNSSSIIDGDHSMVDHYKSGDRGGRRRSRSPDYYRPSEHYGGDRDRYRERDDRDRGSRNSYRGSDRRDGDRRDGDRRRRSPSPRRERKPRTPEPTEDERDRRTVFVQQLAARLRSKDLIAFFEKVGPVKEAQIVKDRISGRSKGVGYVEFKNEESVQGAIQLTGQKLLGIPIIAQLTEAEKNRQTRTADSGGNGNANSVPFHRLYVGNIHFSITETDLQHIFEPFGELEFVSLQKEDETNGGRSRGYGFVQFLDPAQAREALEKMNNFELAGRQIRVGLGNDKFTPESTASLLQRFAGQSQVYQGSAFSGQGGRGAHAGGQGGNFDRAGGRDDQKGAGGASALDDTDVQGVSLNNVSRHKLMGLLAGRVDEPADKAANSRPFNKPSTDVKKLPVQVSQASRCVVLRNCFDAAEESGENWIKELEDDVREECEKKYGHVVHLALDPDTQGDIYVKFDRVTGGEKAVQGLNGRFFGGRTITAQPVVDAVYSSLFARSKAM